MSNIYAELSAAMDAEITLKVLDLLVEIAAQHCVLGEKERAAEILAVVKQYPMHPLTKERALPLWDALECELCPRVIVDATAAADQMTLEDMVALVLTGTTS